MKPSSGISWPGVVFEGVLRGKTTQNTDNERDYPDYAENKQEHKRIEFEKILLKVSAYSVGGELFAFFEREHDRVQNDH